MPFGILLAATVAGLIVWGVVGGLRERGTFTLATAAAFYAQAMVVAGVLTALSGLAILGKLGLSLVDSGWAYVLPVVAPAIYPPIVTRPDAGRFQQEDLIVGVLLVVVGAAVAAGHLLFARFLATRDGGAPGWVVRGTALALTAVTGVTGFVSLIAGGILTLNHVVIGDPTPFATEAAAALVFLTAWAVLLRLLVRRLRIPSVAPA